MTTTITRIGHPVLNEIAQPVTNPISHEIQILTQKMITALKDAGGVGLAASQLYTPLRLFIYHVPKKTTNSRYNLTPQYDPEGVPLTVAINPKVTPLGDQTTIGWEGCLSIPGMMGEVERYHSVQMTATDLNGKEFCLVAHGFHALVLQHEYDHLDGILFPNRLRDIRRFGFIEELSRPSKTPTVPAVKKVLNHN